jgi:hypothetical protein
VQEAILPKDLEHGLHPPDGWDLSAERTGPTVTVLARPSDYHSRS